MGEFLLSLFYGGLHSFAVGAATLIILAPLAALSYGVRRWAVKR